MRDGGNEMTGKKEREVSSRAGNEAGREERRERKGGGMEERGCYLYFSQYLVGWLKTVAMFDPVKLSELAKASTDGWAPSPTTASLGSWYDRGTQRKVNTNIGHSGT